MTRISLAASAVLFGWLTVATAQSMNASIAAEESPTPEIIQSLSGKTFSDHAPSSQELKLNLLSKMKTGVSPAPYAESYWNKNEDYGKDTYKSYNPISIPLW